MIETLVIIGGVTFPMSCPPNEQPVLLPSDDGKAYHLVCEAPLVVAL